MLDQQVAYDILIAMAPGSPMARLRVLLQENCRKWPQSTLNKLFSCRVSCNPTL